MPRAKISDAYGITVELEANEASAEALGDKALEMLAKAVAIVDKRPPGLANGAHTENRWFPAHRDTHYNGVAGFAPVKAGGQ